MKATARKILVSMKVRLKGREHGTVFGGGGQALSDAARSTSFSSPSVLSSGGIK